MCELAVDFAACATAEQANEHHHSQDIVRARFVGRKQYFFLVRQMLFPVRFLE
jgi:hypothetical protein